MGGLPGGRQKQFIVFIILLWGGGKTKKYTMFKLAVLLLIGSLSTSEAFATCHCLCIGGKNQAICDSNFEFPPFCPPKFC